MTRRPWARGIAAALRATGLIVAVALAAGCGSSPPDLSHLDSQGAAGQLARAAMEAHGGLESFRALSDLEYNVVVEQYDAVGVLQGTVRELHRFATAPPRRYVLRRGAARVVERGLMADSAWTRLDGVLVERSEDAEQSRRELAVLSVLNRAPFCLADPGFSLRVLPALPAAGGRPAVQRLAAERAAGPGADVERYVFLFDADSGRVHEVLFEAAQPGGGPPLRVALAEKIREVASVWLVSRWAMAPADATGHAVRLHDTVWSAAEVHADNGFTDDLYRPARAAGS